MESRLLLQNLLSDKTEYYLKFDNPEPVTAIEKFFWLSRLEGRKRAIDYSYQVISTCEEDYLLREVTNDIIGRSNRLGSSTLYKRRLMEGVCTYLNLDEDLEMHCLNLGKALTPKKQDEIMQWLIKFEVGKKFSEKNYPLSGILPF